MSTSEDVISLEDIKAIAIKACGDESVEVIKYTLKPYSKNKIGFLGNHQKLDITVKQTKNSDELVTLTFFVKSMPRDSVEQKEFVKERRVFNQEAEFFNSVMPQLLDATSVGGVEPWAPKCFLANDNVVILEDVRTIGYTMREGKIFETETLKSTARAIARLHAASILAERKLNKPLNELYPNACIEHVFNNTIRKHATRLFGSFIIKIAEINGRNIKGLNEGIERAYNYICNGKSDTRVVSHGDAWPNNAMFDNSSPPKCLLVDYQMVRYAERMFDVAQLLYLSTTREGRKTQEKLAIAAYWNEFCETLRKCDPTIDRPTLEDLTNEFENAKLTAQLNAIIYFPTILLSKNIFEKYENDPQTLFKKYIFRESNKYVLELMENDEEYGNRITEIVMEFLDNCENI